MAFGDIDSCGSGVGTSVAGLTRLNLTTVLIAAMVAAFMTSAVRAQESCAELAKQLANPVSSLISVPFQFNAAFGGGADDKGQWYTLNIQPVIPISIAPDWNLIVRTIVPIVGREDVVAPDFERMGLRQHPPELLLLAEGADCRRDHLGPGSGLQLPDHHRSAVRSEPVGRRPDRRRPAQKGPVTTGLLWNQVWSFEDSSAPDGINNTFLQPFFAYSLGKGLTFNANIQATYSWNTEQWNAPMNAGSPRSSGSAPRT